MLGGGTAGDRDPIRKTVVRSAKGLVVAKHPWAAAIGGQVLAAGGNAVDAAVAAAFALAVVEPYMSGLGGIGLGLYWDGGQARVVDGATRVPVGIDPLGFPVDERAVGAGMFAWPGVVGERNATGATSVSVPTELAVLAKLHALGGSRPWAELVRPAASLARKGLSLDWLTVLNLVELQADFAPKTRDLAMLLPGGRVPRAGLGNPEAGRLPLPALASTLEALAEEGPDVFYRGRIGRAIVEHVAARGGYLGREDLERYAVRLGEGMRVEIGDFAGWLSDGLNGGPTVRRVLELVGNAVAPWDDLRTSARHWIRAGLAAFGERLAQMGHANPGWVPGADPEPGPAHMPWDQLNRPVVKDSTTHLAVVDAEGRGVSLTMTLLSRWGSRVMVPEVGVLLNNGLMWCDPRPGRPNSLAAGAVPLANMAPALLTRGGQLQAMVGASGGRRIIPAIAQLLHGLALSDLSAQEILSRPRVDFSGVPVLVPASLDDPDRRAIAQSAGVPIAVAEHRLGTAPFASPVAVDRRRGRWESGVDPWGMASAAAPSE